MLLTDVDGSRWYLGGVARLPNVGRILPSVAGPTEEVDTNVHTVL